MITISIIIPTLNRANTLRRTLTSIQGQSDLNGVEIIVVDNGSTDDTAEAVKEFISPNGTLHYHYDAEPGLLTGRHLGASVAKGNILCFLDDDVELDLMWLEGVRDAFNDSKVQLATGPCLPCYETQPPDWLKHFWITLNKSDRFCYWLSLMDLADKKKTIHPMSVWGLNFCIRKDALLSLGGFHPDSISSHLQMYQGDGESGLASKAYALKYKCIYHPQIKLLHIISSERLTIDYFKKRAFYQGVCNSYTTLRERYLKTSPRRLTLKSILRHNLSHIKKAIILNRKQADSNEVNEFRNLLTQEEKRGYNFHQQAFKNNAKVKDWVLRKDYWDYKLPR
ncbi:MAG TPA: glycosyltransferase family 2 protein [Segetibacter sp.]